jgi:hypothetical protein
MLLELLDKHHGMRLNVGCGDGIQRNLIPDWTAFNLAVEHKRRSTERHTDITEAHKEHRPRREVSVVPQLSRTRKRLVDEDVSTARRLQYR